MRGATAVTLVAALALGASGCKLDTLVFGARTTDRYVLSGTAIPDSLRAEVTFASGRETLHGFWLRQPGAGPFVTVVFSHGKGGHLAMSDKWAHAEALWTAGFTVLTYDYRGFGRSTGTSTDATTLAADAQAALAFALAQPGVTLPRVVSYGHSLGSAPAIALAAATPALRALVVESGFANGQAMAESADPLGFPVEWLLRDPMLNTARIATVTIPVLVMHGVDDTLIPVEQGRDLFAAVRGARQLQLVAGAGHENVPSVMGPTAYRALLGTFTNAAAPSGARAPGPTSTGSRRHAVWPSPARGHNFWSPSRVPGRTACLLTLTGHLT